MIDRYVKSKFLIAAEMLAGAELLPIRVAKAWAEVSRAEGYEFDDPSMQEDFEWLMSKMEIFAVGDGMPAEGSIAEWDRARTFILKMHSLVGDA